MNFWTFLTYPLKMQAWTQPKRIMRIAHFSSANHLNCLRKIENKYGKWDKLKKIRKMDIYDAIPMRQL